MKRYERPDHYHFTHHKKRSTGNLEIFCYILIAVALLSGIVAFVLPLLLALGVVDPITSVETNKEINYKEPRRLDISSDINRLREEIKKVASKLQISEKELIREVYREPVHKVRDENKTLEAKKETPNNSFVFPVKLPEVELSQEDLVSTLRSSEDRKTTVLTENNLTDDIVYSTISTSEKSIEQDMPEERVADENIENLTMEIDIQQKTDQMSETTTFKVEEPKEPPMESESETGSGVGGTSTEDDSQLDQMLRQSLAGKEESTTFTYLRANEPKLESESEIGSGDTLINDISPTVQMIKESLAAKEESTTLQFEGTKSPTIEIESEIVTGKTLTQINSPTEKTKSSEDDITSQNNIQQTTEAIIYTTKGKTTAIPVTFSAIYNLDTEIVTNINATDTIDPKNVS